MVARRGAVWGLRVSFARAFVRTCMLVQSGLFLERSGGVSCGLVGVLVRLVRWRGAWAFIVVCVSGRVGGVVHCAATVACADV